MRHLPREAYISQNWLEKEQTDLFADAWVFAGVESDFKQAGDYVTLQVGAFPLVILQMKDGALAAFHNLCRHRGTTLLEGQGNTGKSIVCPYHRWTYMLDGRLKGVPDMATCFPDFERADHGLKSASVAVFQGLIFVNAKPQADFESWIAPIKDKVWPHNLEAKDISEAASLTYEMKCNWKVFVENAIDGYHLAYLHEQTLGGPKADENIWERHGPHLLWYATDSEDMRHALPAKSRKEFKKAWATPLKDAAKKSFAGVYYLFPTTLITATPYSFTLSTLSSDAAGTSRMIARNWVGPWQKKDDRKYIPGYNAETGIISSDNWTQPALDTGDFQTEDVWICEKIQQGLNSPAFELGQLAQGAGAEDPIGWFHESLLSNLS